MTFRISALPLEPFAPLFGLSDEELADRGAIRRIADVKPGFPCRVSLQDAEPGERLILVNHEHLPAASPYRARHAVYVRERAIQARPEPGEVPVQLRTRLLSIRAYDEAGMMLAADVTPGAQVEPVIETMLANLEVAFVHIHNAKPGCYAARADRA